MKRSTVLARFAYIVVIALATLSEPALPATSPEVSERLDRALSPELRRKDFVDAVRNVVLFSGWGAVWTITSPPGPAWPIILRGTAAGTLVSIGAEAMQLLTPGRLPSVLDMFTNAAGAFLGALALAVLIVLLRAGIGQRSYVGQPMILFGAGYTMAVLLESFSLLLQDERVAGAWGGVGTRLEVVLRAVSLASLREFPWFDVLLFAPAGGFLVAALAEMHVSRKRAALWVSLLAVPAFVLTQLFRGAGGYAIHAGTPLAHVAGVALGAWLTARALPQLTQKLRGAARPLALCCFYALLLVLWAWRPFWLESDGGMITAKLGADQFIPLKVYRETVNVFTAADALIPACLLFPLGALLAVWPLRRSGWLAGLLPAIYLVTLLEFGQVFIAGRFFDITDVLIAYASLALGWSAAKRAGYSPYGESLSAMPRPGTLATKP